MRIVIESEERAVATAQPTATGQTDLAITVVDAGSPSASLLQSLGATAPMLGQDASQREGLDAGPPAESLVQAIESAAGLLANTATASYFDAGPAPSPKGTVH
jgi:hypothetical protein